jgi:dTDP-4-dehydrorhamnose 3,5-epimerase
MTHQTLSPVIATTLAGVYVVQRPTIRDDRGFFRELFRSEELAQALGAAPVFVQANHSRSQKDTLRGIHAAPWSKLVTVLAGEVQQVVVDLRPDSITFGKHLSLTLGDENLCAIFIPGGCGNAFLTTSAQADYMYLVTDYWAPGKEVGVAYNDADLAIPWQTSKPLVSEKDMQNPALRSVFPEKF